MRLSLCLTSSCVFALALGACTTNPATPSTSERSQAAAEVSQAWAEADSPLLGAAIAGDWRSADNRARDRYRHPQQTLEFFRVGSRSRVVEINPGAGWYSEILGPYLRSSGTYFIAVPSATAGSAGERRNANLKTHLSQHPEQFARTQWLDYDGSLPSFGAPGSADTVVTFRNVHNWVAAGNADAYFKAFHEVLKPGGVLGVVDHRAKPGTDLETMKKSGYLTEELVIELATGAGFKLDGQSEINANPKDDANHPNGVWTLPPANRNDGKNVAKYREIGESDRMTLRFIKQ
ncbi:MAG: methyltransferase [Pseudomonadota bacterium]|nr:methyltransferase [Pseudomonadota bacterium]